GPARLQVCTGEIERRDSGGTASFGLRYVGTCYLTDRETITRCLEFARQHVDVVFAELYDGLVADDIDVGRGCFEQHRLLDITERFAPGPDCRLGDTHAVQCPKPIENGLGGS